ncbi:MAG: efflux RND transporter periplasmic adaptor subunit [Treponema sp.]|nr:efflux RND transporter periplasmic adaptor subunit [Candidatus Treponema equifaecale]
MKIKKSYFVVAGVAALIAVCGIVSHIQRNQNAAPVAKKGGRGGSVVSVKTMTTEITTLHGYVTTNGEVESQNSVSVFPDMAGKVMSTSVLLGSSVKKGDIIAYVDPSAPGTSYRSSPVYAPISGSIISTPLKNGTKVTTSNAIAIIGDISNLQITANVPERYVSVLKNGLKANVSVEAYPDVVFPATVSRVSPVVDATSRTKQIILHFDRHDDRINAGMFAKVVLYTEDYSGSVVMPVDSLVQNGDDYFAYVAKDDDTVSKRKVELGKKVDAMVQIVDGVKAGEKVVIQGQTTLADGSKILDLSNPKKSEKNEKAEKAEKSEKSEKSGKNGEGHGQR